MCVYVYTCYTVLGYGGGLWCVGVDFYVETTDTRMSIDTYVSLYFLKFGKENKNRNS